MDLTCPACRCRGRPHSLVVDSAYRLVCCPRCRTQYFRPDGRSAPPADEVGSEYWESYKFDLYGSPVIQAAFAARYNRVLDDARGQADPLRSVLDIGCGIGNFLAHAEAVGLRAVGTDVDAKAVQVAAERGLTAYVTDELDDRVPDGSMDAVSLWDVIEHVFDPYAMLRVAVAKVRPGGVLLFETPDAAFPVRPVLLGLHRFSGGRVNLTRPMYYWEHKVYFSEQGLRTLLDRLGADGVSVRRETSLREKLAAEFARGAGPLGRLLNATWPVLESGARRLGRGNKLLLVARKRTGAPPGQPQDPRLLQAEPD